jgi:hypothetical protein
VIYARLHESPTAPVSAGDAIAALANAFMEVNWQRPSENFANLGCFDWRHPHLQPWRTLAEIGWSGGGVVAFPLLLADGCVDDPRLRERALHVFDWIARAHNPASGLLWDVCGKHEGTHVNWWWSGYLVKDVHCAYTNGSGLYYLLKALHHERANGRTPPAAWAETACAALDTVCLLQLESGSFGYTYHTERPEIIDASGYAGVWFVPALVLAYRLTRKKQYLEAAERGLAYYRSPVQALNCCGTPMDTWKSPEQEGNLGFIRGAQLLHAELGGDDYLAALAAGAEYEYLWRYGFRARPECAPLRGSPWSSVGGSVTSVSNPHIHTMGIYVSAELAYLAEQTGDDYHRRRCRDGLDWARNLVSLYPDVVGYGVPGVITERWCPSDGLTIDRNPDGSPSSIWRAYNGWAAAALLEGLCEIAY